MPFLLSAGPTPVALLTKLKDVDGAGSGLDADLFHGMATIPVTQGGTGATGGAQAVENLGIVYSAAAPAAPVEGMIWLKPV